MELCASEALTEREAALTAEVAQLRAQLGQPSVRRVRASPHTGAALPAPVAESPSMRLGEAPLPAMLPLEAELPALEAVPLSAGEHVDMLYRLSDAMRPWESPPPRRHERRASDWCGDADAPRTY